MLESLGKSFAKCRDIRVPPVLTRKGTQDIGAGRGEEGGGAVLLLHRNLYQREERKNEAQIVRTLARACGLLDPGVKMAVESCLIVR